MTEMTDDEINFFQYIINNATLIQPLVVLLADQTCFPYL